MAREGWNENVTILGLMPMVRWCVVDLITIGEEGLKILSCRSQSVGPDAITSRDETTPLMLGMVR